jgi:hypothetical protein
MARRTLIIIYIATYLLAIGSIIRFLVRFRDDQFWSIALLCTGYLALLISEPFIFRRNRLLTTVYLLAQIAIISALSFIAPAVDFWAALFLPLVVQVMLNYPQRTGFLITGGFTVIMAILMLLGPGPEVGLPLILINAVVYFLMAAFIAIIREAETANEEIQKQQAGLQSTYQQLQFEGQQVFLQVDDLGVGFDPHTFKATNDHIGLTSKAERVDGMGGVLTIDSHPGHGTRVTVQVTLNGREENIG